MSDPTPIKPQPHHGHRSWTTAWRLNGRAGCKRFGRVGVVSRAEALARFRRWLDTDFAKLRRAAGLSYSLATLCGEYMADVSRHYHDEDGRPTSSISRHRVALETLSERVGDVEADAVTPADVATWLRWVLKHKRYGGAARGEPRTPASANVLLAHVKQMFRWAAELGRVSAGTAGAVQLVRPIRGDDRDAHHPEPTRSVSLADVEATVKHLPADAADMVWLQWWTGMRPGEARRLTWGQVDAADDVWVYRVARHKTRKRGRVRVLAIGPRAQEVLGKYAALRLQPDRLIFPRADGRARTVKDYGRLIARAAKAAGVPHWRPNQLRHAAATRLRLTHGAQAVKDMLGHATLGQQEVYVDDVLARAKAVAKEVG